MMFSFDPFPVLTTERLILREVRETDAAQLFTMRSNEEIMRYIPRPIARSLEDAAAVIDMVNGFTARNERINWAVTEKDRDDLIGMLGYVNIYPDGKRAEIGYSMHPDHLRRGYASEAVQAVIRYGFETMQLHSIEAIINPLNKGSQALAQKLGFVREGYFRDFVFHNGRYWDEEIYSLINPND